MTFSLLNIRPLCKTLAIVTVNVNQIGEKMNFQVKFSNIDANEIEIILDQISEVCPIDNEDLAKKFNFDVDNQAINGLMLQLSQVDEVRLFRRLNDLIPKFVREIDNDFRQIAPSHPAVIAEDIELKGGVPEGVPLMDVLHLATHTDALLHAHPDQAYLSVIENAPGMNILIKASWWYRQLFNTPQVQCFIYYVYQYNPAKVQQLQSDGSWHYLYFDSCFNRFYG